MAEFCPCGSIMLNSQCTNKNCSLKANNPAPAKSRASKAGSQSTKAPKKTRASKASKCVTYNLYDIEEENA